MKSAEKIKVSLGKRIREIRKSKKISLEDLAEKAGMHTTYLGDIERAKGNATITSLAKIAEALDIQVYELFKSFTPIPDESRILENFKLMLKDKDKISHLRNSEWIIRDLFNY